MNKGASALTWDRDLIRGALEDSILVVMQVIEEGQAGGTQDSAGTGCFSLARELS